ncbi:hypothetical protein LCGC14_0684530 [marine sediment metagenome]|uniref:Uncharacterized protein n=1 Tax=marine sediment metagenome TaxID=412755 RepID=A0A0F9QME1_9ZZZZ
MKDEVKLLDFLKDYAKILREGVDISKDLPLSSMVSMPGGGIKITTYDGRCIAFVSIDEGGGPSMPVGPAAMTYAKLFVTLVNKCYENTLNKTESLKSRIENLLKEALSGTSARSKNTIIKEALTLVGDLK